MSDSNAITTPHNTILCSKEAVEIVLLTIMTIIFLKYKYHIHHIISLIIFCLLSFAIDFLLENFEEGLLNQGTLKIVLDFIIIILELSNFCYPSYMMNTLYYHYWTINFYLGLFLFSLNTFFLIAIVTFLGDPYEEIITIIFIIFLEKLNQVLLF